MLIHHTDGLYVANFVRSDGITDVVCGESRADLLRKLQTAMRKERLQMEEGRRARLFLAAWKTGVFLAGPTYFGVNTVGVCSATDKNQLRPVADLEDQAALQSTGQKALLGAMLSFYNEPRGWRYLDSIGVTSPCNLASQLDEMAKETVAQLLMSYCGW